MPKFKDGERVRIKHKKWLLVQETHTSGKLRLPKGATGTIENDSTDAPYVNWDIPHSGVNYVGTKNQHSVPENCLKRIK